MTSTSKNTILLAAITAILSSGCCKRPPSVAPTSKVATTLAVGGKTHHALILDGDVLQVYVPTSEGMSIEALKLSAPVSGRLLSEISSGKTCLASGRLTRTPRDMAPIQITDASLSRLVMGFLPGGEFPPQYEFDVGSCTINTQQLDCGPGGFIPPPRPTLEPIPCPPPKVQELECRSSDQCGESRECRAGVCVEKQPSSSPT